MKRTVDTKQPSARKSRSKSPASASRSNAASADKVALRERQYADFKLQLVSEMAGVGTWEWDVRAAMVYFDPSIVGIFSELDPSQPVPVETFARQVVHPDDIEGYLASMTAAISRKGGDRSVSKFRCVRRDGVVLHVEQHCSIVRDADGRAERVIGASYNITDRVESHDALKREAEAQRKLLERINLATEVATIDIWESDLVTGQLSADTRIFDGGKQFEWRSSRQLLKQIVHPDDLPGYLAALAKAIESGDNFSYRYRMVLPDGERRHVQANGRVFRDSAGNAVRMLGTTMNVTDEVMRLEALEARAAEERALHDRLNLATRTAGIAIWDKDLVRGDFVCDDQFWGLFGLPPDNRFVPRNGIHPDVRDTEFATLKRALVDPSSPEILSIRHRTSNPRPEPHYVQTHIRVFRDSSGNAIRLLGVTWDVTHEVNANARLAQNAAENQRLVDRLNVATEAAGLGAWEYDLVSRRMIWMGKRLSILGLDDEPLDTYYGELEKRVVPEEREPIRQYILESLKKNANVYSFKFRAVGSDGAIHHFRTFAHIVRSAQGTPFRLIGATWDISEEMAANERLRQQAEQARQLTERLNIATDSAGISSWEIDLVESRFLWIENPIKRLRVGGPLDQPLSQYSQRVHPDDKYVFRDEIVRAGKTGMDVIGYRYRGIANDGSIVHVQCHARLYFNDERRAIRALGVSWDITDDISAQEQIEAQARVERELTERLTIATQSAGISGWEVDIENGVYLWADKPLFDFERPGYEDRTLASYARDVHPDDRSVFINEIRAAAKGGYDVIKYRYRCIGPSGSIAHIQAHAQLYFNDARRAVRALGVAWDVTKEVESAERLHNAERRLERASLSSSEGHWEAQLTTGRLWLSSSFHALLGYGEDALAPHVQTFENLIQADDLASYKAAQRSHLDDEQPFDVELRLRTSTGEYRWFRMRGAAERDASGSPAVMAGSIHDVHRQKLAEDALKLAQRRFERAINGTQDALWEFDVASDFMWCSPRMGQLLGYDTRHMENANFLRALIHPDDAARVQHATEAHFDRNEPYDVEFRLRNGDGQYRWYRARGSSERNADGTPLRLSGSTQDVTEARAARDELLQATEAAQAANLAKSSFLANVSHELRTPMNGIIGMTGLLLDTQLDQTQHEFADTIRSSADSLLSIINDILDFSKIEAGKFELDCVEFNLRTVVEDVGAMMAYQAATKGLDLTVNVHPEVPERVMGDPLRLRQCLVNLLGNAVKFTKQGEVAVEVCAVGRRDGRVVTHFEIRDTGIGIPEETQSNLFQPFVQADSSTTRHFGGTGLGLSIVRRLVEMMSGQVGVVSEHGRGSTFYLTIPFEAMDIEATTGSSRALVGGGRILIVDDNATNRRVLSLQLSHVGYDIALADSGAQALATLRTAVERQQPYDLVITDWQMPDMDGPGLAARILEHTAFATTRLIMLTSIDKPGDMQRLAALGFAAYLTKPVRRNELLECVGRVLSSEARQWQMEMRPMITRNALEQVDARTHSGTHALLVEDNAINQKIAKRFLERLGCTMRIVENGNEAIAVFQDERFDIVFMDMQMPVMDGLTAARKLRELESAHPTRPRTPIVALTGNTMAGDRERCLAVGMDGFLTKPLEMQRLRELLDSLRLPLDSDKVGAEQTETHRERRNA